MTTKGRRAHPDRIHLTWRRAQSERSASLSPWAFRLALAGLAILVGGFLIQFWLLITGTDLPTAGSDDRKIEAYARRISDLQAQLERAHSRQALDSDMLNRRLVQISARQAELDSQARLLTALAEGGAKMPVRTADVPLPPPRPGTATPDGVKPAPLEEAPALRLRRLDEAMRETEASHIRALDRLAIVIRERVTRIDGALAASGLRPQGAPASGGPFIPLEEGLGDNGFARRIREVSPLIARHDFLMDVAPRLPLRAPLPGAYEITSHFGARTDPFHGRAGWHAGIDLRDETGSHVLAAGSGRIVSAGWNGAYGQMIEIDHGNGLSTRYGHLSAVLVREGQQISAGERIGLMGSTGRSTGAHLHYEVRLDDRPLDPIRFLRAGQSLIALHADRSRSRDNAQ